MSIVCFKLGPCNAGGFPWRRRRAWLQGQRALRRRLPVQPVRRASTQEDYRFPQTPEGGSPRQQVAHSRFLWLWEVPLQLVGTFNLHSLIRPQLCLGRDLMTLWLCMSIEMDSRLRALLSSIYKRPRHVVWMCDWPLPFIHLHPMNPWWFCSHLS